MGLEIERKFVIHDKNWKDQADIKARKVLKQGYIHAEKGKNVRVRTVDQQAYLTIKGKTEGITRSEFEYEIPYEDAIELFKLCSGSLIDKIRYKVQIGQHVWDIDEFSGDNDGLILAEVELSSEDEAYERSGFIGEEVSHDVRYFNAQLVENPYKNWR